MSHVAAENAGVGGAPSRRRVRLAGSDVGGGSGPVVDKRRRPARSSRCTVFGSVVQLFRC